MCTYVPNYMYTSNTVFPQMIALGPRPIFEGLSIIKNIEISNLNLHFAIK